MNHGNVRETLSPLSRSKSLSLSEIESREREGRESKSSPSNGDDAGDSVPSVPIDFLFFLPLPLSFFLPLSLFQFSPISPHKFFFLSFIHPSLSISPFDTFISSSLSLYIFLSLFLVIFFLSLFLVIFFLSLPVFNCNSYLTRRRKMEEKDGEEGRHIFLFLSLKFLLTL